MPLLTRGFRTAQQRLQHFGDHGTDFGAANENDYESLADAFLGTPQPPRNTLQSRRPRENDLIRYNPLTNEFGILSFDGFIRTYYRPDTAQHLLPRNLDYYFANSVMA